MASNLGPRPETVSHQQTGLLFEAGNYADLREEVKKLIDNPLLCAQMGQSSREKYMQEYGPDRNYHMLMNVYKTAVHSHSSSDRYIENTV